MCITVNASSKVLVARRNIKVYKRLGVISAYGGGTSLISPYQNSRYYLGKLKSAIGQFTKSERQFKRRINNKNDCYESTRTGKLVVSLDHGLHAYTDKDRAIEVSKNYNGHYRIGNTYDRVFLCVIPKGAKYLKGCDNEVISDRLLVVKQLTGIGK